MWTRSMVIMLSPSLIPRKFKLLPPSLSLHPRVLLPFAQPFPFRLWQPLASRERSRRCSSSISNRIRSTARCPSRAASGKLCSAFTGPPRDCGSGETTCARSIRERTFQAPPMRCGFRDTPNALREKSRAQRLPLVPPRRGSRLPPV